MSKFASVLKDIDRMLDIPQPSRSRVILEIQADMEDLYQHYRAQGMDEEMSRKQTLAEFDLSADAIATIAEVHDSALRRFLDRFSTGTRSAVESTALSLTMIPVALVAYRLALSGAMSRDSGAWVWVLAAGTVAAFALGVSKWYALFVVKKHNVRAVRKRLDAVLYIALGQLAVGFIGSYYGLFQAWVESSANKAMTVRYLALWLQGSSALLSTAMIAALLSGLVWIVNSGKVAAIQQYEADLILDTEGE